jgi:hypothetical protein
MQLGRSVQFPSSWSVSPDTDVSTDPHVSVSAFRVLFFQDVVSFQFLWLDAVCHTHLTSFIYLCL